MLLRRLIFCALALALAVGSLQFALQRWQAVPLLLAAEVFEGQKAEAPEAAEHEHADAHAHEHAHEEAHDHDHGAGAWEPANGVERGFWTWVANVMNAMAMALLVLVVASVAVWRRAAPVGWRTLATIAAAGWLSLHFWPSLGLPAELPGMDAPALHQRQALWLLSAASAAAACALLGFGTRAWRWPAAAALLALPFLVGAPQGGDALAGFSGNAREQMQALEQQFVWATTWLALAFWASLGAAALPLFRRFLQPLLLAGRSGTALPVAARA